MIDFPVLSLMTMLPLIGALFIFTIRGDEALVARNARYAALYTSLFVLALALFMLAKFQPGEAG
ncbi:MAG TPA: NADH-quinone oxidoreductase subunit M, partial [Alphaproteobacteria bacterium]